jgi:hypothetical protein
VNGSQHERDTVRDLARQIIEAAHEPRMEAVFRRWRDVNELRTPDRAPVWFRPVGCWPEILPEESLVCTDSWLRGLEREFRRDLWKLTTGDDTPIPPYFSVGAVVNIDPPNVWGIDIHRHGPGVKGGAWAYDPPLRTEADFERLAMPRFQYNEAATQERFERASELLGDIAPVRVTGGPPLGATYGSAAADLRGLEQMMVDMADNPALLHRLMAHLRDATLAAMDEVERAGIVTPNTDDPMTASDPIGEPENGVYCLRNCWCMANSQEFDAVSPAMWEEFCLNYQKPVFERHGLVEYGCCENLTHKIDRVLTIPNLRIMVCSAWTSLDTVIDRCGTDYCIMWRQKASDVVYASVDQVRQDLEGGARRLQGTHYQIVLRELQTLAGNLDRLHVWTRAAIDAAERWAG